MQPLEHQGRLSQASILDNWSLSTHLSGKPTVDPGQSSDFKNFRKDYSISERDVSQDQMRPSRVFLEARYFRL